MAGILLRLLLLFQATLTIGSRDTEARVLRGKSGTNNDKLLPTMKQQLHHIERVVDNEALEEFEKAGIDLTNPDTALDPPGHEADIDDYPFFAYWPGLACGASVIHDDIILTAAHCLQGVGDPLKYRSIRLRRKFRQSIHDNQEENEDAIVRSIAHFELHPDFDSSKPGSPAHDYLILKVDRSVLVRDKGDDQASGSNSSDSSDDGAIDTGVKIIELNRNKSDPLEGDKVHAAGFGKYLHNGTEPESPLSGILLDVELEILPHDLCVDHYGEERMKEDVMLCVGTWDGSKDTCQGDSGGPILDKNNVQVGLVSWGGAKCADPDHAGVAASIANVVPWIESQICALSANPPSSCDPTNTTSFNNKLPAENEIDVYEVEGVNYTKSFDVKITIQHGIAPEETAWTFTHLDSFTLLHYQPFRENIPFVACHTLFRNLVAGTYEFAVSGRGGPDFGFGPGFMSIKNKCNGDVLWKHWGIFKNYMSVTLELDDWGKVVNMTTSTKWFNPSINATDEGTEDTR